MIMDINDFLNNTKEYEKTEKKTDQGGYCHA